MDRFLIECPYNKSKPIHYLFDHLGKASDANPLKTDPYYLDGWDPCGCGDGTECLWDILEDSILWYGVIFSCHARGA